MIKKLLSVLVPVAALLTLVAPAAVAMPMDSVPGSALDYYRTTFDAYHDTAVAEHHGYGLIHDNQNIFCIADPMGSGAMGYHWLNGGLLFDGKISRRHPEAFVYAKRQNGTYALVAVEYIVIKADWDATHAHAPQLFPGHRFMVTPSPNRFDLPAFYSQHVWAWRGNPLGNISMWNPNVHCPPAS
jgi:hypothetical protein